MKVLICSCGVSAVVIGEAMERVYLKVGDKVVAADGEHEWDGGSFHLNEDGDIHVVVSGKALDIYYAFDLNADDPDFGKPFYKASKGV